jgi:hypothetical protein
LQRYGHWLNLYKIRGYLVGMAVAMLMDRFTDCCVRRHSSGGWKGRESYCSGTHGQHDEWRAWHRGMGNSIPNDNRKHDFITQLYIYIHRVENSGTCLRLYIIHRIANSMHRLINLKYLHDEPNGDERE